VAIGSAQSLIAGANRLAIALCASVLLAVLASLGIGSVSATGGGERNIQAEVTMGSDLVTVGHTLHASLSCGHDHKSADCSPCPTCSGALPFTVGGDSNVRTLVRAPLLQSHYDGVVPTGIRRPPRHS
jgi:hypothetical protein